MRARDYRKKAWNKLVGQWFSVSIVVWIQSVLSFLFIWRFIFDGPFNVGKCIIAKKAISKKKPEFNDIFVGFKNFGKHFRMYWSILLWSQVPIYGIIKSYQLSMCYYLLADYPSLSNKEIRITSAKMMRGYKWRLFCLMFSFIGWNLLTTLNFGVSNFFLKPYRETTTAIFYEYVKNNYLRKSGDQKLASLPVGFQDIEDEIDLEEKIIKQPTFDYETGEPLAVFDIDEILKE